MNLPMTLFSRLRRAGELLVSDPPLFVRKIKTKCKKAMAPKSGVVPIRIGGVTFQCEFNLDSNVRNMFAGDYESEIVRLFERHLGPGDTFIDVGANIGYLSAVALNLVGEQGEVHAFEPAPDFFVRLLRLRDENPTYQFFPSNYALGDKAGQWSLAITKAKNIGWNTMVPNFMDSSEIARTVNVHVIRLDSYLHEKRIGTIKLVKIDTEGFEYPVLQGAERFLTASPKKPPIICEIAPHAYPRLGTSLQELRDYMGRLGYRAYDISSRTSIDLLALECTTDVLFLARRQKEYAV